MTEEKVFLTWEKQVEQLETRHLLFENDTERKNAKFTLQNNSYYAVVNGYKDLFCISGDDGVDDFCNESFSNLRDAYDFDKELSSLLFKYLLRIEDSFKAIFSYYTGQKHGHRQEDYLSDVALRRGRQLKRNNDFERDLLRDKLTQIIEKGYSPQIVHYREKYAYTPPWVLASGVSLDSLMYWYKLSNSDVKESTVLTMLYHYEQYPFKYLTDKPETLELFLNLMSIVKEYRNRAAHGNRIMNHKSEHNIKINLLQLYAINRNEIKEVYEEGSLNGDVFSLFITIMVMLSKRGTVRGRYIDDLQNLFSNLERGNGYLYSLILEAVGIPSNFIALLNGIV